MKNSTDKRRKNFIKKAFCSVTLLLSVLLSIEVSVKAEALSSSVEPEESPIPVAEEISLLEAQILSLYGESTDGIISYDIKTNLERMRSLSPEQAEKWDELMGYWQYVNTDMPINTEVCPENLVKDKSLCIVVMGYRLTNVGTASKELKTRLQTALDLSKKYPQAYIAVTGGPTASKNKRASEGKVMANWLISHGVKKNRLIIESNSMTTVDNAVLTAALLDEHPEIKDIVIVTSDYHIRRSCLVFQTQMIMSGRSVRVVSNYACPCKPDAGLDISTQVSSVKQILDSMKN